MKRINWVLKIGTHKCPDHEPEHFGIDEPTSKNYAGQMLEPLVKWGKQEDASAATQND